MDGGQPAPSLLGGALTCETCAPRGGNESLQQLPPSKMILGHIPALDSVCKYPLLSKCPLGSNIYFFSLLVDYSSLFCLSLDEEHVAATCSYQLKPVFFF